MSEPTMDQPRTAETHQRKFARERLMSLRDQVKGSTIYGVPIEQLDRDELLGAVASLMIDHASTRASLVQMTELASIPVRPGRQGLFGRMVKP